MTEFEFLFSVFGLLIGLTLVEIAVKFADAIDAHHRRPIGILTPLLAFFVLFDVASYWLFAWSLRDVLHVRWRTVFIGLSVAMTYYLAASLIFPRSEGKWVNLDEHYWARKRLVIGGVLLVGRDDGMAIDPRASVFARYLVLDLPAALFHADDRPDVHADAAGRHWVVCGPDRNDAVL
jgi:hypothetical protein